MVAVPPRTTGDLLILIILIVLVMISIMIVDWISKGGPPTGRYFLMDFIVSALIIIVPPILVSIFDFLASLISDSLQLGDLAPYIAFIVAIYSIKKLLHFPRVRYQNDRSWENAIWVSFFAFMIYIIIAEIIQAVAAALG